MQLSDKTARRDAHNNNGMNGQQKIATQQTTQQPAIAILHYAGTIIVARATAATAED